MSKTSNARRRPPRSEAFWRNTIVAWRNSGLSATTFAREHDLHPTSLYKWANRLRSTVRQAPVSSTSPPPSLFVPVNVVSPTEGASDGEAEQQPLEVVLPNGVVIRIQESAVAQMLPAVLCVATELMAC